jgi:hypothetical protein
MHMCGLMFSAATVQCVLVHAECVHKSSRDNTKYMLRDLCIVFDKSVHACNAGLGCSSKQTDIAPALSMLCAIYTSFHIVILGCL